MKPLTIFSIIVCIFFISACANPLGGGGSIKSSGEGVDFVFLENQPPTTEIYENQKFRAGINLINYGTEDNEINLCLSDSLSNYFDGMGESCRIVLLDKAELSGNEILQQEKKVYFPSQDQFYQYTNLEPGMSSTIIAELYYKFKTIANGQICIKRDLEAETPVKCYITSQEQLTQNPAPVKISSVEKNVFPLGNNKVQLTLKINIANSGTGVVIDKDTIKSREVKDPKVDLNVNLKGITTSFECRPKMSDGRILLDKAKTITCISEIPINDQFIENPLEITIEYGYKLKKNIGPINLVSKEEI